MKAWSSNPTMYRQNDIKDTLRQVLVDAVPFQRDGCQAKCGKMADQRIYLWQYVVTGGQKSGSHTDDWELYSCLYACTDSYEHPPKCPPSLCTNSECQFCNGQYNTGQCKDLTNMANEKWHSAQG